MKTKMYDHLTEMQERIDLFKNAMRGLLEALECMPPDYIATPYVHSRICEAQKALNADPPKEERP